MDAVIAGAQNLSSFSHNVFLVDNPSSGILGIADPDQPFAFVFVDAHGATDNVNNTISHELGHTLELEHPDEMGDPDVENLMHSVERGEKLRKNQWDTINP